MGNVYTTVPVLCTSLTSQKDLDNAVVAATPNSVKFAGLVVNIPFGKRGSTQVRSTAKGYGARWDGSEWTLPAAKYVVGNGTNGALDWFRTNNLILGIKTRTYVPFVWDGANQHHLVLDIAFDDRQSAKSQGAHWGQAISKWYIPAGNITQAIVDALNKSECIAGYMDPLTGQAIQQQPAPVTAPYSPSFIRPAAGAVTNSDCNWSADPTSPIGFLRHTALSHKLALHEVNVEPNSRLHMLQGQTPSGLGYVVGFQECSEEICVFVADKALVYNLHADNADTRLVTAKAIDAVKNSQTTSTFGSAIAFVCDASAAATIYETLANTYTLTPFNIA